MFSKFKPAGRKDTVLYTSKTYKLKLDNTKQA
jgi:hypothetical protein